MPDLEGEYSFLCPYCMASNTLSVDFTGGRSQSFTVDCEVCCKPVSIRFEAGPEGIIRFDAQRES